MITYINAADKTTKIFTYTYDINKIQKEVTYVILLYLSYLKKITAIKQNKDDSINDLSFPYPYRKGQRNIVKNVYKTISEGKNLLLCPRYGCRAKIAFGYVPSLKFIAGKDAKIVLFVKQGTQKKNAPPKL
jgi:hypothetical protein